MTFNIPKAGSIYTSTKNPDISFYIETSTTLDEGFTLLTVVRTEDKDDMGAMADEMEIKQWHSLVIRFDLALTSINEIDDDAGQRAVTFFGIADDDY